MNNREAVLYGETETHLTAEWCDRALDDDDRYEPDSIFIRVEVLKELGTKQLNSELYKQFDLWMEERT